MKNLVLALFALLMRVYDSNAELPDSNQDGEAIVLDTPTLKWALLPSDACYFQAYKLDECWTMDYYDLGACIECMVEGQSDPMNPSCTDIDLETIQSCSDSKCYGADFCNEKAMELFTCIGEECSQDPSNAVLPAANADGEATVFDTPLIKWEFLPSDACYFQAYKLDKCWTMDFYDFGACVECVLEGQSDPMNMSCTDMSLETIQACSDSKCYGADFCNDRAMQFFSCIYEECTEDPPDDVDDGSNVDTFDIDICPYEAIDFATCLATTDYDIESCTECTFADQDPDNFSCSLVDCAAIGDCRDSTCGVCADEFHTFLNCALGEVCEVMCIGPGDTCYNETSTANSCAASLQHMNECLSCATAGQADPSNPTCSEIDCDAYEECLENNCGDCKDEYMASFACGDKASRCDIICSDSTSGFRRLGKHPHHFRGRGKNRKGARANSPRTKSH